MKEIWNLAIMGAGKIARLMGETVQKTPHFHGCAVASRELARAQELADAFGFERAYGSYEQMLADEQVDLVYIATPHSHHAAHIRQCLEAGKHVLCEKAFCLNAAQTREVLALAKEKGLLLAEAIWPRYMPMAKVLTDFAASGKIGRIHHVSANLGYPVWEQERVHALALGGGALLDVGIYPLNFISLLLGHRVTAIQVAADICPNEGSDRSESVVLTYESGATAALYNTLVGPTDRLGVIYGETGYAVVENVNNYESLRVYDAQRNLVEEHMAPPQITGYEYELEHCAEALRNGWLETPAMEHGEIVRMMELMDRIRKEMGLRYPTEAEN